MATADSPPAEKNDSGPYLAVDRFSSYSTLFRNNKNYRCFWLAGVISQLGNWFNYIAIFVLLTRLTGSGMAVSWFLIAKFIPTSFLGPAAGVVADRFSRKTIMVANDLVRVLIVLGFLLVRSPEQVWLVYLLALAQESAWTFYDPARRALVPTICRANELVLANALSGATWSIMLAVGAAAGGFVTYLLGWRAAILLDSVTFLVSAGIILRLDLPHTLKARKSVSWQDYTGLRDLKEGCRYLIQNREVAFLLLVKSGWALSGGILVLLTVFGEQVFATAGAAGGKSGILYSFRGIGAAIGPIVAWRLLGQTRDAMYRGIALSFFISSLAYLFFARAPTLAYAAVFVLFGHMGGSIQWVFSTTLLQQMVPNEFRGRVFAAEMALLTFVLSLSTYFTGLGLDHGTDPRILTVRLALLFLLPGSIWLVYIMASSRSRNRSA